MRRMSFLVLLFLLFTSVSLFAQGFGNECTPAGVWFGGGTNNAKYLMTIVPSRAGRFTVTGFEGFTPNPLPPASAAKLSPYAGEFFKLSNGKYRGFAMALVNSDTIPPAGPGSTGNTPPRIWALRETVELTDCDTLVTSIDFSAEYSWGKTPFVDAPDFHKLTPGTTINETYHRMPTECTTACPEE